MSNSLSKWSMIICGLVSQVLHAIILTDFPYVKLLSVQFVGTIVMLFVNHYLAFKHFTWQYYNFSEVNEMNEFDWFVQIEAKHIFNLIWMEFLFQVLGYFTICLWIVPFALFVSLSANDNVLPTVNERTTLLSMFVFFLL